METMSRVVATNLASDLDKQLRAHEAFAHLDRFGRLSRSRPFSSNELETFFASLWVFFEEVPTGILALALNICDATRHVSTWRSTELAARVLTANVDEFGLRQSGDRTHHQLFVALVNSLGLTGTQLLQSRRVLASAYRLAGTTGRLYRSPDIIAGIGLHLASELTSSVEFGHFDAAFRAHAASYGVGTQSDADPFHFFHIHTLVEPEHYASAVELAVEVAALSGDGELRRRLIFGAQAFLDDFGALFRDFNEMLDRGR